MSKEEAEELFEEFDSDKSETLDIDELKRLVEKPTRLHEWVKTLPLVDIVVDAMRAILLKQGEDSFTDPLRMVSELSSEERQAVCATLHHCLEGILADACAGLRNAFESKSSNEGKTKSQLVGKFQVCGEDKVMAGGSIFDFQAGIEARIGERLTMVFFLLLALSVPG